MKTIAVGLLIIGLFVAYLVIGSREASKQYQATQQQVQVSRESRAYLRVLACEFAVPPLQRTPEHIESCYNKVETKENLKLERY